MWTRSLARRSKERPQQEPNLEGCGHNAWRRNQKRCGLVRSVAKLNLCSLPGTRQASIFEGHRKCVRHKKDAPGAKTSSAILPVARWLDGSQSVVRASRLGKAHVCLHRPLRGCIGVNVHRHASRGRARAMGARAASTICSHSSVG